MTSSDLALCVIVGAVCAVFIVITVANMIRIERDR